jgi:hypothetical protein
LKDANGPKVVGSKNNNYNSPEVNSKSIKVDIRAGKGNVQPELEKTDIKEDRKDSEERPAAGKAPDVVLYQSQGQGQGQRPFQNLTASQAVA